MTSLFTTIIAIVLLSVVAVAGLFFMDVDETRAGIQAPAVASSLSNLVESASLFNESRGNLPVSMEDMETEFDGLNAQAVNGQYFISNNIGCIGLDYSETNEQRLQAARLRVAGSVVSNSCGDIESNGRRYLAVSLDGVSTPQADVFLASLAVDGTGNAPLPAPALLRGQAPFNDLNEVCGIQPEPTASNEDKGRYISCYLSDFNRAARAWVLGGRGLTPSANELFAAGFISHPQPNFPELSLISVTSDDRFLGLLNFTRDTGRIPYGSVAFFDPGGSFNINNRRVAEATAPNSSEQTVSVLNVPHVYMAPIIFDDQFDQVDTSPFEPDSVPDEDSSTDEIASYVAFWLLQNGQVAREWSAAGNIADTNNPFTFSRLQQDGFQSVPVPALSNGSEFRIETPSRFDTDRRTFLRHRINSRLGGSQTLCRSIEDFSYRQARCRSFGSFFFNEIPIN